MYIHFTAGDIRRCSLQSIRDKLGANSVGGRLNIQVTDMWNKNY